LRNDAVRFVEGDEHRWSFKCRVSSFKKIVLVLVIEGASGHCHQRTMPRPRGTPDSSGRCATGACCCRMNPAFRRWCRGAPRNRTMEARTSRLHCTSPRQGNEGDSFLFVFFAFFVVKSIP
jgi:hypothetical protein